jgi:hypothetical protein
VIGGVEASPSEGNRRRGPLTLELVVAVVAHNSFFRVSHLAFDLTHITATWTFIFISHNWATFIASDTAPDPRNKSSTVSPSVYPIASNTQ